MRLPIPLIRASIDDCLKQFFACIVPSREADLTQNFADNRHRDQSTILILEELVELRMQFRALEGGDFDGQPVQFARRFEVSHVVGKLDCLLSTPVGGARAIDEGANFDEQCSFEEAPACSG